MRVLRFLIVSLLVIGVTSGVVALVAREVLLMWGLSQIKSSVTSMRKIANNTGSYLQDCQKKGIIDPNIPLIGTIQLRFISSNEYVVEVVCAQFQLDPIIVSQTTLPMFVTKVPGQSGIVWGDNLSGIALTAYGRTRAVVLENLDVKYVSYSNTTFLGTGPLTSCSGFGFSCCQAESTLGQGDQLSGVLDCPRSCYSQCVSRPMVLSFFTQPFFDPQTRQLNIANGELVEFSYVADFVDQPQSTVVIDFGDGSPTETLPPLPVTLIILLIVLKVFVGIPLKLWFKVQKMFRRQKHQSLR